MDNKTNINWYPGHMAKTKREIDKLLPIVDIVYELIDSRIPLSSRIEDIDNIVKNKPRIIVMTKSDLCDLTETKKWIDKYESEGHKVVLVNLNDNNDYKKVLTATKEITSELNKKREAKGLKEKDIHALVVGIPNVGKSTFINRLAGKKVANVGNKPGVTTNLTWLKTNAGVLLLDTPGILWPKIDNKDVACNLASMTAIKEEVLNTDEIAIYIINTLLKYYKDNLINRYSLTNANDLISILDNIGNKIGAIKAGKVDYDRVYLRIIKDLQDGYLGKVTFDR